MSFPGPRKRELGPKAPMEDLKAPKGARIDGWGGKASAPTAINSIVGSPGPNSHRPHNGVWAQYPLRGWPEERGPTQPIPGGWAVGGGAARTPSSGKAAVGCGSSSAHTARGPPKPKRERPKAAAPPTPGSVPSRPHPPLFFSLYLSIFFLLNFISRTAPSWLGTPRHSRALLPRLSRYRYLRPFGVARSSLHVQFPSLGLPPPPPFPFFLCSRPSFCPRAPRGCDEGGGRGAVIPPRR